jgi:hypothetical protein
MAVRAVGCPAASGRSKGEEVEEEVLALGDELVGAAGVSLLKSHEVGIPPAATPPAALRALQDRVRGLSSNPNRKIKRTC